MEFGMRMSLRPLNLHRGVQALMEMIKAPEAERGGSGGEGAGSPVQVALFALGNMAGHREVAEVGANLQQRLRHTVTEVHRHNFLFQRSSRMSRLLMASIRARSQASERACVAVGSVPNA